MTKQEQIAQFVRSRAGVAQSFDFKMPWETTQPAITPEHLAQVLVQDAEFRSLQLGAALTTPDGELIAEGVGIALPPCMRPEYHLWVQAMRIAAGMQQREGRQRAGQASLAVVLLGIGVIAVAVAGSAS